MPHFPSNCKMLILCFHFQTTFTFLEKQGFLLKEYYVPSFKKKIRVYSDQVFLWRKKFLSVRLEHPLCHHSSRLLGVGRGVLAKTCKTATSCVTLAYTDGFNFLTLNMKGLNQATGCGRGFLHLLCSLCLAFCRCSRNTE